MSLTASQQNAVQALSLAGNQLPVLQQNGVELGSLFVDVFEDLNEVTAGLTDPLSPADGTLTVNGQLEIPSDDSHVGSSGFEIVDHGVPGYWRLGIQGSTNLNYALAHNGSNTVINGGASIGFGAGNNSLGSAGLSNPGWRLVSFVPDSATAVGFELITSIDLADPSSKIVSLVRGATEKLYIDLEGDIVWPNTTTTRLENSGSRITLAASSGVILARGGTNLTVNGASVIANAASSDPFKVQSGSSDRWIFRSTGALEYDNGGALFAVDASGFVTAQGTFPVPVVDTGASILSADRFALWDDANKKMKVTPFRVLGTAQFEAVGGSRIDFESNVPFAFFSDRANVASAIAYQFDVFATLTDSTALHTEWKNGGSVIAFMDKDGIVNWTDGSGVKSVGGGGNNLIYRAVSTHDFRTSAGAGGTGILNAGQILASIYRPFGASSAVSLMAATGLAATDADVRYIQLQTQTSPPDSVAANPIEIRGTNLMLNKQTTPGDGDTIDSRILRLRAGYDADPGAGVTATDFDVEIQHVMEVAGASPESRLAFSIGGSELMALGHDGLLNLTTDDALGGGAMALLGTIGGTGPTTSTQSKWLKVQIDGVDHWIAVWV